MRAQISNLKSQNCKKVKVALAMVNSKVMKKLKKTWFGRGENTDVVAFPLQEKTSGGVYLLGEVIINLDQAKKQAREYQVPLPEEIARLTAHGALHLLGYEDESEESKQKMAEIEEKVIGRVKRR